MKQIKRIIAVLLCLTLMLTMLPLTVFAAGERPTDPALIDDKDKTTDLDYDFELNEDLEGEYNGIKYEWNHETKTLFVDGIKPESTLRDFSHTAGNCNFLQRIAVVNGRLFHHAHRHSVKRSGNRHRTGNIRSRNNFISDREISLSVFILKLFQIPYSSRIRGRSEASLRADRRRRRRACADIQIPDRAVF